MNCFGFGNMEWIHRYMFVLGIFKCDLTSIDFKYWKDIILVKEKN